MILILFVTDLVYIITTEKKTLLKTDFALENVRDHWRVNSSITFLFKDITLQEDGIKCVGLV